MRVIVGIVSIRLAVLATHATAPSLATFFARVAVATDTADGDASARVHQELVEALAGLSNLSLKAI